MTFSPPKTVSRITYPEEFLGELTCASHICVSFLKLGLPSLSPLQNSLPLTHIVKTRAGRQKGDIYVSVYMLTHVYVTLTLRSHNIYKRTIVSKPRRGTRPVGTHLCTSRTVNKVSNRAKSIRARVDKQLGTHTSRRVLT